MPNTKKILTVQTSAAGETYLVISEADPATGKSVSTPTRLGPFKYAEADLRGAAENAAAKAFGAPQLTVNELRAFVDALGVEFKAMSLALAIKKWVKG
ncbi:MAG: hypothetical protein P4L33_20470 [Capsulimonadaceae bacterium]|nr:hypothetical protein [Capsulimonadaceae bacterium]